MPISSGVPTSPEVIRAKFFDVYQKTREPATAKVAEIMELGLPSDGLQEQYHYYETLPHPRIWVRGKNRVRKAFKGVQFTVENKDWELTIPYHSNDADDDRTRSLDTLIHAGAQNLAHLPERVFFQILTAGSDPDLLPNVPLAPDGAALFAATAGGSARFGATGGNIITGSGTTAAQIRTDFWSVLARFAEFKDTEDQPLWSDNMLEGTYLIVFNAQNQEAFREAFDLKRVEGTGGSTPTNIFQDAGVKFMLWPSSRITDDDFYVSLTSAPFKPLFQQRRQAPREMDWNFENSDRARDTKVLEIGWDIRDGYGIAVPYQFIKVNN
jgi:phage major head subunit gpT-like protein